MSNPDFIDVIVSMNDDETVGTILVEDEKKADFTNARVKTEYLRDVLDMADSMGWEELWISVRDSESMVLVESDGDHGPGEIGLAPIYPRDDEGDSDE